MEFQEKIIGVNVGEGVHIVDKELGKMMFQRGSYGFFFNMRGLNAGIHKLNARKYYNMVQ